jgi:ATP dependent DNA ligase domain/ATP dependent DNA ligase C terminal region
MPTTTLIDLGRFEIKLGSYAVGPATALNNPLATSIAQEYRRNVSGRMIPLGKDDIRAKISSSEFFVSRKIDGEFTVLMFDEGQAYTINPGGTVRVGLPWLEEAALALQAAGITQARIAGELYVHDARQRTRVHDVSTITRGPRSTAELDKLRFAPFDIIQIDGQPAEASYANTFQTLQRLFGKTERVQPVETEVVRDVSGILRLFEKWVEQQEAEGLVVRSDAAGLFKVKQRHNLDVVVVGFTESGEERQGMLHDMLVAVMRADGTYQILTRVGGGFSEDQRRTFLSDLKDLAVSSEYVEVNSDYVAYQMVRPQWIIEISCLDLISQTTRGGPVNRMVIDFDEQAGFRVVRRLPLASVISPQFVRRREDKQSHPDDVRIAQVSDRVEVDLIDADAKSFRLPTTQVVRREVFIKSLKGATMVRKFLLMKTNKEDVSEEYPAYVVHFTDFSPNREEPLQREVAVSNSLEQIEELYGKFKAENVKKGWVAV